MCNIVTYAYSFTTQSIKNVIELLFKSFSMHMLNIQLPFASMAWYAFLYNSRTCQVVSCKSYTTTRLDPGLKKYYKIQPKPSQENAYSFKTKLSP